MELGQRPKELVFQTFYCTVCLSYIQSCGNSSKPTQTRNNPQKLQLQGASDREECFVWKLKTQV